MNHYEQDAPEPQGILTLRITALPRETNGFGNVYGGWLVSQMDLAGTAMACRLAVGQVATVSIDRMAFMMPVEVGSQLCFYTQPLEISRTSVRSWWKCGKKTSSHRCYARSLRVFLYSLPLTMPGVPVLFPVLNGSTELTHLF
ncbi:thioesterase superfamily protein [Azomonas agilis]|uniref:Thioesterase superfamily protein n=1 Tax=Azomonas agilis TaxID=116849 RepID=A0A562I0F2_9GAMM|nr:thioesterase superfamily protein [Azomonas agilis]